MPQQSMPNLPGFDAINDTLEFVRNMWGGAKSPIGIPGMVMPTLSVDEINKQIADLKAVESWLTINMNMLRGTIQALEVQSATLSTLKSMSDAMGDAMGKAAQPAEPAPGYSFNAPPAREKEEPKPAPKVEPKVEPSTGTQQKTDDKAAPAPTLPDPAAWWNMLQAQFNQAVNSAIVPEASAPSAAKKKAAVQPKAPTAPKAAPRKPKA